MQNQVRASLTSTPSTRRLLDGVAVHPNSLVDSAQASGPKVSDDLPEDTALRVIGPPVAFALIIIIGSQVVHFK